MAANEDGKKSPAVAAAKTRHSPDEVVVMSTGVRAKLRPVAASLITEVTNRIKDPTVPVWNNPDKPTESHPEGRPEPNPNDAGYIEGRKHAAEQRSMAALDAMVLFGVELVDGLPEDDSWVKKLKFLEKLGHVDLSAYDPSDPLDMEFLFKRYIAVSSADLEKIGSLMGLSEEAVQRAAESFPGVEA